MSSTDNIKSNPHEMEDLSQVSLYQMTIDSPFPPDPNTVTASPAMASKSDKSNLHDPELKEVSNK